MVASFDRHLQLLLAKEGLTKLSTGVQSPVEAGGVRQGSRRR
jgi:hypothetical protein